MPDVNVRTGPTTLFFDLGEVGFLIPIGFRIVVVGNRVESRGSGCSLTHDLVRHTHNRRRIDAATEFSKYRCISPQTSANGRGKDTPKVLFIVRISSIADLLARIKVPVLL